MKGDANASRFLYLPDPHGVFVDDAAFECALRFGHRHRPDLVVCGGDFVDFYQLSSFDKDPQRLLDLQADCDAAAHLLHKVRRSFKHAVIYFLVGNHEDRLRRFLWKHAPALKSLRSLELPRLLKLGENNIIYQPHGTIKIRKLLFKHGNLVRRGAGATARAELDAEGISGVSGHTHRIGSASKTNRGGRYTWLESGCLCKLTPEYMPGQVPDWQQGLSYGFFTAGDRFSISTAHIIGGKTMYGDHVISAA